MFFPVQERRYPGSVSDSDAKWTLEDAGEGSSSMAPGIRKQSLRNIKPRSYSSLLRSESEEEEEEEMEVDKSDKLTVKPNVAAAFSQGNRPLSVSLLVAVTLNMSCVK